MSGDSQRLARLFTVIAAITAMVVPIDIYVATHRPDLWILAACSFGLLLVLLACRQLARRGQTGWAAEIFCIVLLVSMPILPLFVPWAAASVTVIMLVPLTVAVVWLRGSRLMAIIAASVAVVAFATLWGAFHPAHVMVPLAARLAWTSVAPTAAALIIVFLMKQTSDRQLAIIADERAARAEAAASEQRYRALFDKSPLPKWLMDAETLRFVEVNDAALRTYGFTRDEFLGMRISDIRPPEDAPPLLAAMQAPGSVGRWRHRKKDGTLMTVEITGHSMIVGGRHHRLIVANDVTERGRLEAQLRQAQKMDAIGRLAGGVAHDFNNLLSVILSYGQFALEDLAPGDPLRADMEQICAAGNRAANLTRQLLTFSRQQVLAPKLVRLGALVAGMETMLRRLVGEDIEMRVVLDDALGRVRVDPASIEQTIMNLVVNARDAMPTGGRMTIETRNALLDDDYASRHLGLRPGPYVLLRVSDDGIGMDEATQARVFEPFFTTKDKSKGTGLGLSTVFGIVKQSGGHITLRSAPGAGATFDIYLPRVNGVEAPLEPPAVAPLMHGSETVLVVEDEHDVRAAACGILRRYGYHVLEAAGGREALQLCEKEARKIDLVISDVVMPHMSGPELAKRLALLRPETRVLWMSGYTDDTTLRHGVVDAEVAFLQKPITVETLTRNVRELLDAPPRPPASTKW